LLQWIYQAIVMVMAFLVASVILRERDTGKQIGGAMVLILLLLRIFLVK